MEIERNKVVNIRNFIKVWEVVKGKNWYKSTKQHFNKFQEKAKISKLQGSQK